jgi:proline iminopeptidase
VGTAARERYVPVDGAQLYVREIGAGAPVIVLHGGPDFDHFYLLPELDEVAAACRLVYYDQRGRGRSAAAVQAQDVSIESEVADLDQLRRHLELDTVALLGHSWGGVLAMEYAIAHPARVSHLILLGTAPASGAEAERLFQQWRADRTESERERLAQIAATPAFLAGSPAADIEYYRLHYRSAVRQTDDVDRLAARLRAHFDEPGVRLARSIEQRQDMAARIAAAMPKARLVVLPGCAHFPFLDDPVLVRNVVADLLGAAH